MRARILLALLSLCSGAPAPFDKNDAKHTHDGNKIRKEKVFDNSQINMGYLHVNSVTGDNNQIGHKLDINVVKTHGVQSVKENADDSPGHAPASHDGDFEERLHKLFKTMDADEDGIISVAELIRICNENNIYISEPEAEKVLTLPEETVPFTLPYFLAILDNAASSSDTSDLIQFLLQSAGFQDHLMFDKNLMHVFLALDADHDCMIFVPDILSVFQDLGKTISLDEAKRLLSSYRGHNHHDGVDFNLWKKLILGEVFKQNSNLVNYWRDAFIELKKSFDVELTDFSVGDLKRTDIVNAAKTAVKALKHGSELGECYQGELLEVESATVEVVEGLQYKLQLRISTKGGEDCMEGIEMICENILMTKPLPKDCKGTDTVELVDREHITCEKVKAPLVLWTGPHYPSLTFELPSLTPANSDCQVTDPGIDGFESVFQEVKGKFYGCNHYECKQYFPEENIWTTIPGMKFVYERAYPAGTVVGDKWVVQGGYDHYPTAEVWIPGTGKWVEAPEFKSPIPVHGHCLVTLDDKLMQIGGISESEQGLTSRCFLDGDEVARLKSPRTHHACAVFQGQVWVAGGSRDDDAYDAVEIYDPDKDTWGDGPKRPSTQVDVKPQLVENSGQLLYIGGDKIGKIYKLNRNKDDWEEVGDVEMVEKFAAFVMEKQKKGVYSDVDRSDETDLGPISDQVLKWSYNDPNNREKAKGWFSMWRG